MPDPNESPQQIEMDGGLRAAFNDADPAELRSSVLRLLQEKARSKLDLCLHDETEPEDTDAPVTIDEETKALRDPTGRYQVLGEIGRGGVGVVYKGRDQDLGRDVAMKLLRPEYVDRPEILERFVEEAQIGGQLQHPGIVPVYDLGLQHGERPYFAMKLVKGETLDAILQRRTRPEEDRRRLLGVFEQVCQTVAYAHARRVVHRDLKPQNVMVGGFGEVQIVDWGFAKVLPKDAKAAPSKESLASVASVISTVRSDPDKGTHSVVGSVLGTPAYMPPEQATGDVDHMDRQSDVFGLGAILCEILTGQPPYLEVDGDMVQQAARADLQGAYDRIDNCSADAAVKGLCKQCLSAARRARPGSAREVAEAIGTHLTSVEERAQQARIHAAEARVRARSAVWLSAAAVLLLALGGGGWFYFDREARSQSERADQRVASVMEDAGVRFGMARVAAVVDLSLWTRALDAADQAVELAQAEEVTAAKRQAAVDLRERIRAGQSEAQAEATRLAKAARIRNRLREARVPVDDNILDESYQTREARRRSGAYAAAFTEYLDGRDLRKMTAPAGTTALAGDLAVEFAAALDDWVASRMYLAQTSKDDPPDAAATAVLRGIAAALDPDPLRSRVRSAVAGETRDKDLLLGLLAEADLQALPVATLSLLANALADVEADAEARRVYEVALERFPDDFGSAFGLAFLHERAREWREALAGFRIAGAVHPELREVWHRAGNALFGLRRYKAAERLFRRLLSEEPDQAHWLWHLGNCLSRQRRWPEAKAVFERVLAFNPEQASAHGLLGQVLYRLGEVDEAEHHLRRSIELGPKDDSYHVSLGIIMLDRGELDGAEACFRQALQLDPDSKAAWTNWGIVLSMTNRLDEAAQKHLRAIEVDPEYPNSHNNLGEVRYRQGRFQEALKAYRRAIELDSRIAAPHRGVSNCLSKLGQLEDALESAKEAVAIDPGSSSSHGTLGDRLADLGRYDAAVESYRRAIELQASWRTHANLSRVLIKLGKHDEAIQSIRNALAIQETGQCWNQLGALLANHRQEYPEAIECFQKAAALEPDHGEPHLNLGKVLGRLGRTEEALQAFRRAEAINERTGCFSLVMRLSLRGLIAAAKTDVEKKEALLEKVRNGAEIEDPRFLQQAAEWLHDKEEYLLAARTYRRALEALPEKRETYPYRYNEACAAALAGLGMGKDAASLNGKQRTELRERARAALTLERDRWRQAIAKGGNASKLAKQRVRHALQDPDFAGLRGKALEALDEGEAEAWRALWKELAELGRGRPK